MKFRRSTRTGDPPKDTVAPLKVKTIDQKSKRKDVKSKVQFKFFALEEKENQGGSRWGKRRPPPPPPRTFTPPLTTRRTEDVLSERLAQGLSLWSNGGGGGDEAQTTTDSTEAKPIAKPVLSFVGTHNYFKRSFSMRARTTQAQPPEETTGEQRTATIRRAFGKSLTSKRIECAFV